jgi:hypothetical protein
MTSRHDRPHAPEWPQPRTRADPAQSSLRSWWRAAHDRPSSRTAAGRILAPDGRQALRAPRGPASRPGTYSAASVRVRSVRRRHARESGGRAGRAPSRGFLFPCRNSWRVDGACDKLHVGAPLRPWTRCSSRRSVVTSRPSDVVRGTVVRRAIGALGPSEAETWRGAPHHRPRRDERENASRASWRG